jgi:large subunit ribosomal protein L21
VYAIFADGSHQYRVEEGQLLAVQRKDLDENQNQVEFDRVLLVGDREGGALIGKPVVEGAKVTASVVREVQGPKLVSRKYRRRKASAWKKGHRQDYLQIKIEKIEAAG